MSVEWRKCSVCKKSIQLGQIYQKCSVSTCRKSVYCSVECWDVHVPILNHKSAWAEEERAPTQLASDEKPRRRIVVSSPAKTNFKEDIPKDILIVVSKLKNYIKLKSDMNTSGDVSDILSDIVRRYCDDAIDEARVQGRKTVMARDFTTNKKSSF